MFCYMYVAQIQDAQMNELSRVLDSLESVMNKEHSLSASYEFIEAGTTDIINR